MHLQERIVLRRRIALRPTVLRGERRQLLLMALAQLAVERPGWNDALSLIALHCDNRIADGEKAGKPVMYEQFQELHAFLPFCRAPGSPRVNRPPPPRGNGAGVSRCTFSNLIVMSFNGMHLQQRIVLRRPPPRSVCPANRRGGRSQCVRLKPEPRSRRQSRNCRIGAATEITEDSADHREMVSERSGIST